MKRNKEPAYQFISSEDRKKVDEFIQETEAAGGMAPLDSERFWEENAAACAEPFCPPEAVVPFGASLTSECVFDELGLEEDFRRQLTDHRWRSEVHRAYNDKAEEIVGKRLLNESLPDLQHSYPPHGGLHSIFEAEQIWKDQSWWLMQSAENEAELSSLLDRVEARLAAPDYTGIRSCVLPEGWEECRDRLLPAGIKPGPYRAQRGPVTFAMSIYGVENLIFLIMDNPGLALRFSRLISESMIALAEMLDREAGYGNGIDEGKEKDGADRHVKADGNKSSRPHPAEEDGPARGFMFFDDNCALLNLEMYEVFALPVLQQVFERYAPKPDDRRFQHSDSDMAHLLPALAKLDLTGTNFGPTVTVSDIRRFLPRAVIQGQLAPFSYSRNELENIGAEFFRDMRQAEEKKGLVFSAAGSINNGTRLTTMRFLMGLMQRWGRYGS